MKNTSDNVVTIQGIKLTQEAIDQLYSFQTIKIPEFNDSTGIDFATSYVQDAIEFMIRVSATFNTGLDHDAICIMAELLTVKQQLETLRYPDMPHGS